MPRSALVLFCVLGLTACSPPPTPPAEVVTAPEADAEPTEALEPEGAAGGGEESQAPERLTGLPGIDHAQDLELRILDARGTGRIGGRAIAAGEVSPLTTGEWMLTDAGSEYEITLRSGMLPDGIVRLDGRSAFLVEAPVANPLPRFRVFGGHASFYLPQLPEGELTVLTPSGPLITRGAVFTVTVAPDGQVLVTCREGEVYLTGAQNAVALPGQVLVADRLGRGRAYVMTPNESLVFAERWLAIMSEESGTVLSTSLPRRLAAWRTALQFGDTEEQRFLALWFREARAVLGEAVPGPDAWSSALATEVRGSVWKHPADAPGLLGELP